MNLWNIEKVKDDLSNQKISQRDLLVYYFLIGLLAAILVIPVDSIFDYFQEENYKWIDWGLTNFIELTTIFLCYKANKGIKGSNFIERIISLQIILSIRYFVFFLIPFEIFHGVFLEATPYSDIGNLMSSNIFVLIVCIRSVQCMNDVQNI